MELNQLDNPFENTRPLPIGKEEEIKVALGRKRRKKAVDIGVPHRLSALAEEHELTKKYEPKFIGKGGEHLVYTLKGHPNFVVKAQKQPLAQTMAWNEQSGLETGDDSIAVLELREGKLLEERKRYQKLRDVFGDHVLFQKFFVMQVPVGPAVREELNEDPNLYQFNIPEKADAGWTIVSIQKRAEALDDPRNLSMGGGNLEGHLVKANKWKEKETKKLYRRVTDGLMDRDRAEASDISSEDLKSLMALTHLRSLLQKAERDPGLAEALADFQKKAVKFSEINGDILDIVGVNNITFYRDMDGAWTYTLIDGLYPFDTKVLEKGSEVLIKKDMGLSTDLKEENAYGQSINYVRVINGLGKVLNTGAYIDFTPPELKERKSLYGDQILGKEQAA